jgi:hypothetical protein
VAANTIFWPWSSSRRHFTCFWRIYPELRAPTWCTISRSS